MTGKQGNFYSIFEDELKKTISPFLKDCGFKKKGRLWNRKRADFVDVIFCQISEKCSNKNHINFTINFGISIPTINHLIFEKETASPTFENDTDCIIRARPGELIINSSKKPKEIWWDIKSEEDFKPVFFEVEEIIKMNAMSFFDFFNLNSKIEPYLFEKPRRYNSDGFGLLQLAVFCFLKGNKENGKKLFQKVINQGGSWGERSQKIAQKLNVFYK